MKKCHQGHENPDNAMFCRICGLKIEDETHIPFFMAHPEYHLRPFSEFVGINLFFGKPEYMEDPRTSSMSNYFYIAKKGKLGIIYWRYEGGQNDYWIVIRCKYERIEKRDRMFVCQYGSETVYIDLKGNILK